jgi:DNA-binding NarL/FixJ family response regulator
MVGNLLVASADTQTRDLAKKLFARAGFTTQQLASGEAALAAIDQSKPGLILIDLQLEDMSGYELCYEVKQRFGADTPIILLSEDRTEPHDRVAGLLLGADDYLAKPFDPGELLARVRRVLSRSTLNEVPDFELTPRETEVLHLLAQGLGREAVAKQLVVSPKTVATHVQHILAKLGVHSTTEAVAQAYRAGLVEQSDNGGRDALERGGGL